MNFSFFSKMSWASYAFSLKRSAQTFLAIFILLIGSYSNVDAQIEIQIDVVEFITTSEGSIANIYPNPASSQISIEPESNKTVSTIEIFTTGMVLVVSLDAVDQESFTITLNPGNYYFKIKTQDSETTKLIQIVEA